MIVSKTLETVCLFSGNISFLKVSKFSHFLFNVPNRIFFCVIQLPRVELQCSIFSSFAHREWSACMLPFESFVK